MKKRISKLLKLLSVCLMVCSMAVTPVLAAEPTMNVEPTINIKSSIPLIFITPEEMEQLIAIQENGNQQGGIATYSNWFPDVVLVSVFRESDGHCKIVFMNEGFIFDKCDVYGTVMLYDTSMRVVAKREIAEPKLTWGVARVVHIYPVGGKYATGSYDIILADGGSATPYMGTF